MKVIEVLKFHILRIVKTPSIIGAIVGFPVILITLFTVINLSGSQGDTQNNKVEPSEDVASVILIGENNETIQEDLIKADFGENLWTDSDKAHAYLAEGRIGVIYIIPDNYLEDIDQPIKVALRDESSRSTSAEHVINQIVYQKALKEALLTNKLIEQDSAVDFQYVDQITINSTSQTSLDDIMNAMSSIVVVILYIIMNGNMIGTDLVSLNKENVIRRSITTPNESWKILGTLLVAYAIVIFTVNMVLLSVIKVLNNLDMTMYLRSLYVVILGIVFSLSFAIMLFRLFKEPNLAVNTGMLIFIGLTGLTFIDSISSSTWIKNLSYLSPMKWLLNILDSGEVLQGTIVVLLMSLVLFTAGSYKLEKYVKRA